MQRVKVVLGGEWNDSAVQRCLGVSPFSVPPVLHPVLMIDGFAEPDATAWLGDGCAVLEDLVRGGCDAGSGIAGLRNRESYRRFVLGRYLPDE